MKINSVQKTEIDNSFGFGVTDDSDTDIGLNYIPREGGGIVYPPTPPIDTSCRSGGGGGGGAACKGPGSATVQPTYILRKNLYNTK